MMNNSDAMLLIGHGSRNQDATEEYRQFAQQIAARLGIHVEPCFLEFADPPIVDGFRACVGQGYTNIVALPLFLGAAGHQKNDVPAIINWARTEWPQLNIRYGTPLGAQYHMVDVLQSRAQDAIAYASVHVPLEETAVIVVGRGSRDPDSNAEVARLARLLYEGRNYGWVEPAYYALTTPGIDTVVQRCVRMGAQRVVLLPYLLFTGRIYQRILEQASNASEKYNIEALVSHYLFAHENLVETVVHRYEEVTDSRANMTCDLCKYRRKFDGFENEFGLPQTSDHSHGLRGVPHSHGFEAKLAAILPPQYTNGDSPSAAPMAAADLRFDNEGDVAWNEMWTDFCDLALAGGPTHRGDLLEPVDPMTVQQNPKRYASVLSELERGLRLVTELPVVKSQSLGWIGLTSLRISSSFC